MIKITLNNCHKDLTYDYPHLFGIFMPEETLVFDTQEAFSSTAEVVHVFEQTLTEGFILGKLTLDDGRSFTATTSVIHLFETYKVERDLKVFFKLNAYDILSQVKAPSSPWGTLVGIRPVKLAHEAMDFDMDDETMKAYLYDYYRISEDKIALMMTIAKEERQVLTEPEDNKVSLYICIPFCQSKCVYCSFPSNPLDKKGHLRTAYTDALVKEIEATAARIAASGLVVDCLYIGGGTPTALDELNFKRVLAAVDTHFDRLQLKEYTVEAGRPDTLTEDKLLLMKHYGVTRLCLNPQTMNDSTLKAIGRTHNAQDIVHWYEKARHYGFDTINADLIVGLMDEDLSHMRVTIDALLALGPENVTLHTLAVKRASRLNENREAYELQAAKQVEAMMELASAELERYGYVPYYMYRQKQMIGNLENIGYAKPGKNCLYNIRIMEERHSIVALGAGSVSKLFFAAENRLERFSNSKGLEDYIGRIDELIEKKNNWLTSKYHLL